MDIMVQGPSVAVVQLGPGANSHLCPFQSPDEEMVATSLPFKKGASQFLKKERKPGNSA